MERRTKRGCCPTWLLSRGCGRLRCVQALVQQPQGRVAVGQSFFAVLFKLQAGAKQGGGGAGHCEQGLAAIGVQAIKAASSCKVTWTCVRS